MPLDFGAVAEASSGFAGADSAEASAKTRPVDAGPPRHIGADLRAAREFRGLSLQDMADATRIRRSYLAALEDLKLEQLPSRPFTTGYVRAYAQAVGLDAESAVKRFKADAPGRAEPLRAPVGVSRERDPRLTIVAGGVAAVLSAVLIWNLAQHAVAQDSAPSPVLPDAAVPAAPPGAGAQAPVVLSAAQPAPQESTLPAPYVTPGLPQVDASGAQIAPDKAADAAAAAALAEPVAGAIAPVRAAFNPKGAIYGAPPLQSSVTLQARKAASLIIRGPDGAVYFARQLAAGEAYRAPMMKGLTIDVSEPAAFAVYTNGEFSGGLDAPQTPIARLAG